MYTKEERGKTDPPEHGAQAEGQQQAQSSKGQQDQADESERVSSMAARLGHMSRETSGGRKASSTKAAGKAAAKGKAKSKVLKGVARESQLKNVSEVVADASRLKQQVLGETSLEGLVRYEVEIKDITQKLAGKDDLLLDLDVEDAGLLQRCRENVAFAGPCRDCMKAWKAFSHSGTEKNLKNFTQKWGQFRELLPSDCGLIQAAVNDLMKPRVGALVHNGEFAKASQMCGVGHLSEAYSLTDVAHVQTVQKTHLATIFKQVARRLHPQIDVLAAKWDECAEQVGEIKDPALMRAVNAFSTAFNFQDVDSTILVSALEYLAGAQGDVFVKNVAVVTSANIRAAKEHASGKHVESRQATMKHMAVAQIAREAAKTAAAVAAGTPWLPQEVEKHVLEWRGLASSLQMEKDAAPHLAVGDDWQKANASLADLWDSALPLFFEPAFARLCEVMKDLPPAPTIAAGDGVPDMCQQVTVSLASLGAELRCQAASWLDNRRQSNQSGGQHEDRVRYMSNVAQLAVVLKDTLSESDQSDTCSALCKAYDEVKRSTTDINGREAVDALLQKAWSMAERISADSFEAAHQKWQAMLLRMPDSTPSGTFLPAMDLTRKCGGIEGLCGHRAEAGRRAVLIQCQKLMDMVPAARGRQHQATAAQFWTRVDIARDAVMRLEGANVGSGSQLPEFAAALKKALGAEKPSEEVDRLVDRGAASLVKIDKALPVLLQSALEQLELMNEAHLQLTRLREGGMEDITPVELAVQDQLMKDAQKRVAAARASLRDEYASVYACAAEHIWPLLPDFEGTCGRRDVKQLVSETAQNPLAPAIPPVVGALTKLADAMKSVGADAVAAEVVKSCNHARSFIGACHVCNLLWVDFPQWVEDPAKQVAEQKKCKAQCAKQHIVLPEFLAQALNPPPADLISW